MGPWLLQLAVGSLGLLVAALFAVALLRLWRRRPVVSYRLLVAVLVVTVELVAVGVGQSPQDGGRAGRRAARRTLTAARPSRHRRGGVAA